MRGYSKQMAVKTKQAKQVVLVCSSLTQSYLLFVTSWTAACQASLSSTISQSLLRFVSIESVMLSNHLILCHPRLCLPSFFPSIIVFSSEWAVPIWWPKLVQPFIDIRQERFQAKNCKKDKDIHFIMIKEKIHQEDISY